MPDYSKAKIYKMESPSGLVYVGSTCKSLSLRKAGHKTDYKRWKKGNRCFITSFKLFDDEINEIDDEIDDNIKIYLIENFPCENNKQLHVREGYWIKKTECVNKHIPSRTSNEYWVDNTEKYIKKKERNKKYHENKKEELLEKKKVKYHCDCGSICGIHKKQIHFRSTKHQEFMDNKQQ